MTEVAPLRDASTLTDEERHLIASFEPAVAALSALFGPGCEVVLHAFECAVVSGEPRPLASDGLAWVDVDRLGKYAMGKIDRMIAEEIGNKV